MSTLNQTAKLNSVDPQACLANVLARIADTPQTNLPELLPWKTARGALARTSCVTAAHAGGLRSITLVAAKRPGESHP